MHEIGKAGEHRGRLAALPVLVFELQQSSFDVAVHERFEKIDDARAVNETEHGGHAVGADGRSAMGDRLIKQRQPVAHRSFGGAGDRAQGLRLDLGILRPGDLREMLHEQPGIETPEVKTLAARKNGDRNLADLGRRENELHMRRRLLQGLQQRAERRLRQHVHFVDDIDLVGGADRLVANRFDDLTHVVDTGMRGGIQLNHVDVT